MDEAGVTGFYEVLLGSTGFYEVLLGSTRFYWVLRGSTRFYWVLRGSAGFYEVLPGSTRLCSDAARREAAERGDILLCPEADNLLRQVAASN
jgi:hypothetical protein